MQIKRFDKNPILTPADVTPYHAGFEVIGVFNAGVAKYKNQTLLLLRVAERPISQVENKVYAPIFNVTENKVEKIEYDLDDAKYIFDDPRTIRQNDKTNKISHLTSLSYIRIARSTNDVDFEVDDDPFLYPYDQYTTYGIEDARCTQIGEDYVVTYTSVSELGIGVSAIKTANFEDYVHLGNIFAPENKDILIFPEKVNNRYYALHRPSSSSLGGLNIWLASSPDLISWGNHKYLFGTREGSWESQRIGGGLPPIKTKLGWLVIYHGANENSRYCMGAALLDKNDPSIILARLNHPILEPEMEYEQKGFFGDVVFGCGSVLDGDDLIVYYGASDTTMAGCVLSISEILKRLEEEL
ncbi:BtaManbiosPhlase [Fundicoccus culcitae]|uniref:Glycosidase n=1 Tax=Fundicoccus culcitae TaxID=2969821 RepID=A0ABY5P8N6_9LACT|nr:glycosidase [Fundicoccus culcitae]UUX35123.1 glycosidase [Fundicoccus culcitae]